jgi:hypothetical protein
MASTDESWMYGEFKNYKVYARILIENCRNIPDLLSAFIYPTFAELISYFKKFTSMTVWW